MFRRSAGFTLVELLVVVAIIAILASILFPVFAAAKMSAKKTACLSNMRQIGLGLMMYTDDYDGMMPSSAHTAYQQDRCWIALLNPYLGNTKELRMCPADPKARQRVAAGGSSYILNEYLVVDGIDAHLNIQTLPKPADTITTFIISDRAGASWTNDHTHSRTWFLPPSSSVWTRIVRDIQPDRHKVGPPAPPHTDGSSNYLYADGHAKSIPAKQVKGWADTGFNFAKPPTDSIYP
jgi:prepilin-type N-terminal cleavage/methylation domain-containing protein/prepilin-type processing-associated H-X9-DG protein